MPLPIPMLWGYSDPESTPSVCLPPSGAFSVYRSPLERDAALRMYLPSQELQKVLDNSPPAATSPQTGGIQRLHVAMGYGHSGLTPAIDTKSSMFCASCGEYAGFDYGNGKPCPICNHVAGAWKATLGAAAVIQKKKKASEEAAEKAAANAKAAAAAKVAFLEAEAKAAEAAKEAAAAEGAKIEAEKLAKEAALTEAENHQLLVAAAEFANQKALEAKSRATKEQLEADMASKELDVTRKALEQAVASFEKESKEASQASVAVVREKMMWHEAVEAGEEASHIVVLKASYDKDPNPNPNRSTKGVL